MQRKSSAQNAEVERREKIQTPRHFRIWKVHFRFFSLLLCAMQQENV